ncbi:phage portal protein [Lysobacteraceae bacterium NML91-0213]|nr:phage portal protein [Xanthomonadaceae bacterium NML91-0213]
MMRAPSLGPNVVTMFSLGEIVARSRAATRNDPWAGAAQDKLVANGIGTGIQAKGQWGDREYRKREKRLWLRWGKICDADGVLNFDGLQALLWREYDEAGEVFIRLRNRRLADGLPVPLQLQVIEAEQCPPHYYAQASNGNQIRAGIEFDAIGRRVAYWMYGQHPGDFHAGADFDATRLRRVPADEVLHIFEPMRAGQIRGIPRATSALVRMFNLDSLDDAVLERQKIANLFGGFFEMDLPEEEEDDGHRVYDELHGRPGDPAADPDGTPLAGLEPGTMGQLPPGWKAKFSEPPSAGSDYPDYYRHGLLAIAARRGVPYEVLTGDLRNVSDRALRLILNEFRRFIEMVQWLVLIPMALQPIREAYLDRAVLAGALDVPGYDELREDVVETLWVPQGWPYSHPVQDVDADIKAIRGGLDTRTAAVLRKGEDPEEVNEQLQADNVDADARGLVLDTDPRKVSTAGLTQARPAGTVLPNNDPGDIP